MSFRKDLFVKRRRQLNLTQQQIADEVGVSSRTVQRWELGENLPELTILQASRLCNLLKCSIDDLAKDFYPEEFSS
jgi:transcriptional regulator with XRE-family HTH domain